MKTLIFGTMYLHSRETKDVANLWIDWANKTGHNWILIDSDSPTYLKYLLHTNLEEYVLDLGNNIGHLSLNGADGWGRAFCAGLQKAIDENYDYVAHVEGDLLINFSIDRVIENLKKTNKKVASPEFDRINTNNPEVKSIETGIMIMDVDYIKSSNLIQQYDWTIRKRVPRPETRLWTIVKDVWFPLKLTGGRNDGLKWNDNDIKDFDYLTHAPLHQMKQIVKEMY